MPISCSSMPISCSSMPISCSSMPISCIASHKSNSITSSPLALAIRRAACVASHTAHADACLSVVQACLSGMPVTVRGTAFGGDQLMRDRPPTNGSARSKYFRNIVPPGPNISIFGPPLNKVSSHGVQLGLR